MTHIVIANDNRHVEKAFYQGNGCQIDNKKAKNITFLVIFLAVINYDKKISFLISKIFYSFMILYSALF